MRGAEADDIFELKPVSQPFSCKSRRSRANRGRCVDAPFLPPVEAPAGPKIDARKIDAPQLLVAKNAFVFRSKPV